MGVLDNNVYKDEKSEVTRRIEYPQVSVIPLQFRETVRDLPPIRRRCYEVKMPLWYVKKHREERGDVVFCDMEYDSRIGARFTERPEEAYVII